MEPTCCETVNSGACTGAGADARLCLEYLVEGTQDNNVAKQLAFEKLPPLPVSIPSIGANLNVVQHQSTEPVGDCLLVKICLVTETVAGQAGLCEPGDFQISFDVSTVDTEIFNSYGSICYSETGVQQFTSLPLDNFDGTFGCVRRAPVARKCLSFCYPPGFIDNAWFRTLKEVVGSLNRFAFYGCQSCEALLAGVTGSASLVDPFQVEFCWDIDCFRQVPIVIGRPTTSCNGTRCQINYPAPIFVDRPPWSKQRLKKCKYIPCAGTDCAEAEQEFIKQVYFDQIDFKFDHTSLFPPGFRQQLQTAEFKIIPRQFISSQQALRAGATIETQSAENGLGA